LRVNGLLLVSLAIGLLAVSGAACGSDDEPDLEIYAGWYDLTEAFEKDVGVTCPPPQVEITENTVQVLVDGSRFEARFGQRWGDLLGEIHEDGHFISSGNLGPDQALRFTGHFEEEILISGLDDIRGASCTRTFSINGTRRVDNQ
jgi:hypothetical protein